MRSEQRALLAFRHQRQHGGPFDAASGGEVCGTDQARVVLPVQADRLPEDACETDGGYALLLGAKLFDSSSQRDVMVVSFGKTGKEQVREAVAPAVGETLQYTRIRAAEHGTLALLAHVSMSSPSFTKSIVQFLGTDLKPLSSLTTSSTANGAWLDDGRWISVGTSITLATAPKGSPAEGTEGGYEDWQPFAYYTITTKLDSGQPAVPDDPDNPDDPVVPDNPDDPDGPDEPDTTQGDVEPMAKLLARTGDASDAKAGAACAAALPGLAGLACANRVRRASKRRD